MKSFKIKKRNLKKESFFNDNKSYEVFSFRELREKEILLSLTVRFSKNNELLTGFVATSMLADVVFVWDSFLARIFKTAAKAGKI